ncbi:FecR domain-containing protein [Hyphomicrobium sp. 2TAF46]
MDPIDQDSPDTMLRRAALDKIQRLVSGDATAEDVEDIRRWRRLSPAHEAAFASATRLWDRLGPAVGSAEQRRATDAAASPSPRRVTRRMIVGGVAAASAAYLIARPPFEIWPSYAELTADYRTATGEQHRIALAEGASVLLNTQTSLSLRPSDDDDDRIELITGEAAITIDRELVRPLRVIAGDGRISARRSTFNVRYDGRNVGVTCLDGRVRVEQGESAVSLEASQQARYNAAGLGALVAIDAATATAWREGLLVFQAAPLAEVIAEINRYRPGRVILMNDALGQRQVNARFRIDKVDDVLALAQRLYGAKLTTLPGGVVLLS